TQSPPTTTLATPLRPLNTPAAPASGIRLTAMMGPTCPGPERPGQVCTQPYTGVFVVTKADAEVARITTDQNGKATINLPPGEYTLTPELEGRSPSGGPTTVTVLSGQYVEVSVELDTGIR
ncbi:MAG TPA: prealbumin-like fold domain-containing protein, partial [Anaerolineae bacterium]|nr:prealbumin-like fold domain-containing protein [Anaerolineae bacterium]